MTLFPYTTLFRSLEHLSANQREQTDLACLRSDNESVVLRAREEATRRLGHKCESNDNSRELDDDKLRLSGPNNNQVAARHHFFDR
jgi:hypothetical protein